MISTRISALFVCAAILAGCLRLSGAVKSEPVQSGASEIALARPPALVKEINPSGDGPAMGFLGSNPPVRLGDAIYFAADDGVNGTELWRSDGTPDGTWLVKDIAPGAASSDPTGFAVSGSWLYFAANDGSSGTELWRSDGTAAGTTQVKDLWPGATGSTPRSLLGTDGFLYFFAASDTGGLEPWRSDGTAAGTLQLVDVNPGAADSETGTWGQAGGIVYFSASTGFSGGLWRTDGTPGGTSLLHDYASFGVSLVRNFQEFAGQLFFSAKSSGGTELWRSDGTAPGTAMVKDLFPGANSSSPASLTVFNGSLFFGAETSLYANMLWKSDGTGAGTVAIHPGIVSDLFVSGSLLYFRLGGEPWVSDGSAVGTRLLRRINPDSSSLAYPPHFTTLGDWTYFAADDGVNGRGLWRTNGTEEGSARIAGLALAPYTFVIPLGSRLLVLGSDATRGQELWAVEP
ncbi:MAG: hypothetical protein NDJ89_11175 [Oligoflexia bacterium]|nr:hypothetical protein [Oligoflexia bacterium]